MSESIKKKINDLENEIRLHQKYYYIDNKPKISDKEFDILFKELQSLEKSYPDYVSKNSPTKIVGSDLDNTFEKYKHKIPVLSLENTYSNDELIEWATKLSPNEIFSFEWKVDGASIVLYYLNGELEKAVTRGTGGIGDDITENIRTIKNIPLVLSDKIDIFVRGEVYMDFQDFNDFNEENGGKYANPRNLTSGSIKQKNSNLVASRPLKIAVYDAYFPKDTAFNNHKTLLEYLNKLNFPILKDTEFKNIDHFEKIILNFKKKKEKIKFPTDGLVIKLNDLSLRNELGETSHSPRWARALKFEVTMAETTIENIDFAIGRTGKLTPRAKVTPVKLLGTTVTYATLHNQDYINEKKIGIGARVKIAKRGEIIPAVEEVIEEPLKIFTLPKNCPTCNSILKKIDDSVDYFCLNKSCNSRIINSLIFFCQRKQMDIEGLGEKMIEFLFEKSYIKSIPDIYDLKNKKSELETLDGLGKKSVTIILEGIEKSKEKDLKLLLPSLGFTDIGHKVTEILIESGYTDIELLISIVKDFNGRDKLSSLFGLGEKTIQSLFRELTEPNNISLIYDLKERGLNFQSEKVKKSNNLIFLNQIWCVTGTFDNFNPREKALEIIDYYGGKKTTTVSSKTTHLLVGDGGGSKLEKANKFGVTLVTEIEFLKLLKSGGYNESVF
jgi:DNA ligase (NAD+)